MHLRIGGVLAIACAALTVGSSVGTANAAPTASATGVVSNGIAFTDAAAGVGRYCTIAAVGTDSSGNKVAISAAHCVSNEPDGTVMYRSQPDGTAGQALGTIANRGWQGATEVKDRDWLVIKLYDDAILSSNGPRARIDSIATTPLRTFQDIVCKDGQSTGVTCGLVVAQNDSAVYNLAAIFSGDSGGAAFTRNTQWVGVNYGLELPPGTRYLRASKILADIEAGSNPVGKGFTITNTP